MVADGYFEHASHDGTAFWKRIGRWYGSYGYTLWAVGENLSGRRPTCRPRGGQALDEIARAPREHPRREVAGDRRLRLARPSAPGTFRGLPVTIVTTDFGARS